NVSRRHFCFLKENEERLDLQQGDPQQLTRHTNMWHCGKCSTLVTSAPRTAVAPADQRCCLATAQQHLLAGVESFCVRCAPNKRAEDLWIPVKIRRRSVQPGPFVLRQCPPQSPVLRVPVMPRSARDAPRLLLHLPRALLQPLDHLRRRTRCANIP
ncbi:hypothetical protein JZ751_012655, partial [Albula glossodonta]